MHEQGLADLAVTDEGHLLTALHELASQPVHAAEVRAECLEPVQSGRALVGAVRRHGFSLPALHVLARQELVVLLAETLLVAGEVRHQTEGVGHAAACRLCTST
ncbi:hypothetical protein A4E84_14365 [Streptomyces qaidamensis]|uniref:Uncharacterized protein n=1 Tax=Streptomyces qaidamensis TaxID=1783515 RepID=A0A143BZJ3_9ACTN|nr:hypothetical protein A4E84_14365 [Streptomyces qaidamensis]